MKKPDAMIVAVAEPESEKSAGKIVFAAPEALDLEGKEIGDTLEAVSEFKIEEDGRLCLKKINGLEVAGYGGKATKPDSRSLAETFPEDPEEDY